MAITFVAIGTSASVATGASCAPGTPAGIANNDILVLCVTSPGGATITCDNGFTEKVAGGDTVNGTMKVFYKRTTGTEGTTTVSRSGGNGLGCQMAAYRGCKTSGDPFNIAGTVQLNTATQPISTTSITTTVANCMALHVVSNVNDILHSSWTGTQTTERIDFVDAVTTPDEAIAMAEGIKASAGATGAAGTTAASPTAAGTSVQLALEPGANDWTITGSGSTSFILASGLSKQQNLVLSGAPYTHFTPVGQLQRDHLLLGNPTTTFAPVGNPVIQHNLVLTGAPQTKWIPSGNLSGPVQSWVLTGVGSTTFSAIGSLFKDVNILGQGTTRFILAGNLEKDVQTPQEPFVKKYPFRAYRQ